MRFATCSASATATRASSRSTRRNQRVLHLFPLYLYKFSDGLFVVVGARPARRWSARRCSRSTASRRDELERQVRPLVPRDNEATRTDRFMSFLLTAEVLHGLGPAGGDRPGTRSRSTARRRRRRR